MDSKQYFLDEYYHPEYSKGSDIRGNFADILAHSAILNMVLGFRNHEISECDLWEYAKTKMQGYERELEMMSRFYAVVWADNIVFVYKGYYSDIYWDAPLGLDFKPQRSYTQHFRLTPYYLFKMYNEHKITVKTMDDMIKTKYINRKVSSFQPDLALEIQF